MTSILHPLYYAVVPQGSVITPRAHGIDISKYDLSFEPALATGQLDFVFQRVSYRRTRDEAFETLLPGVMSMPIRMGYHYLNSNTDWKSQADAYLSYVQGLEYHAHVCDFEGAFNILSTAFAHECWRWIDYVAQKTGKLTMLYTGRYLYQDWLTPSEKIYGINWNNVPLWIAQYFYVPNPNGAPVMPTGRSAGWKFWQYTDRGQGAALYGTGRAEACDLDVFNGSVTELMKFLKIDSGGEEPPIGGGMEEYKIVTPGLKIRTAPPVGSVLGPDAGKVMLQGDLIHISEKDQASGWLRISKWIKAAGGEVIPPEGVQWWCSGLTSYVQFVRLVNEPEEPGEPGLQAFDVGVMVVREGYRDGFATVRMEPK